MSDMSSLSHEYASSADFSREINDAVLLLKKRFIGGAKPKTEPPDSDDTILRLRDILASLLQHLRGSIDLSAEQQEMAIPEDVLSRIIEEHRGDLAYFREDLRHLVTVLSSQSCIGRKVLEVLDSICEAADASASATFRKLWRRSDAFCRPSTSSTTSGTSPDPFRYSQQYWTVAGTDLRISADIAAGS